jgi:predicted nucleic acid-binding protein
MSVVLLDTNIVSYLIKDDSRARIYAPYLANREPAIAIMTVAELFQWTMVRKWGQTRIKRLESEVDHYTVLLVDIPTCRAWASIRAKRQAIGEPISPQDAWIAATAVRYNLPLITHNPRDYRSIDGLVIITGLTD